MIGIISDIHGNYDALLAVLAEAETLGAEQLLCLGDMVGYGPEPVECVDQVRACCEVVLCGNHDFALVYGADNFSPLAQDTLERHRSQMMPRPSDASSYEERRERWEFVKDLPYRHVREDWLFVHASPRNPIMEYLRKVDVMLGMTEKVGENLRQVDWLCFIGHTHQPGVITRNMEFFSPDELGGAFTPRPHEKAIINVGSVGQPRDGDWRPCFVTVEDDGTVHYHRVEYDIQSVASKLTAVGTDLAMAERLRRGR
jgi:diadenosine tetraphosphatase ApaH/serine/threonine PP2A family protein phosphatase